MGLIDNYKLEPKKIIHEGVNIKKIILEIILQ